MSWMPSSSAATATASLIQRELDRRELLEGSLLAVCADCKDMVLQVRCVVQLSSACNSHHTCTGCYICSETWV